MTISLAAASDAGLLASLHARCFAESWKEHAFAQFFAQTNVFALVAREAETPAGFMVVRVAADEAEILSLGLVPELRRRGQARQLVLFASQHAFEAGARSLFLEVDVNNAAARGLYTQLGFEHAGRRAGYYRTCNSLADALIFRRALPIPAWESALSSTSLVSRNG